MLTVLNGITNPEPIITAVLAALEAQRSVFLTNWLLITLIIMAGMVAIGVGIIIMMVQKIQEHTNGMHTQLIDATRKLALIEGEVKGRADLIAEEKAAEVKTEK